MPDACINCQDFAPAYFVFGLFVFGAQRHGGPGYNCLPVGLKIEFTGGTVRAEVRPRQRWRLIPALMAYFIFGATLISFGLPAIAQIDLPALWRSILEGMLVVMCTTGMLLLCTLSLFDFEKIIVTEDVLEIRSMALGFTRSERSFENELVRNLRFDRWAGPIRAGPQNGVRFEYKTETVTFAQQAGQADCQALIDRMCNVYKFSLQDPAFPPVGNWDHWG